MWYANYIKGKKVLEEEMINMTIMKKAFYLGLGALTLTREKAEKICAELIEKGEMSKEEARQFINEAVKKGEEEKEGLQTLISEEFKKIKNDLSLVTRKEFEALQSRISELEKRLQ